MFDEFESKLHKERRLAETANAKAAEKYKGRKPSIDKERIKSMLGEGL